MDEICTASVNTVTAMFAVSALDSVMKRAFFSCYDMLAHKPVKTFEITAIWPSGKTVCLLEVC